MPDAGEQVQGQKPLQIDKPILQNVFWLALDQICPYAHKPFSRTSPICFIRAEITHIGD